MLCEMQSVSSRIWTRVAVFISYDDNDYTTGTSRITSGDLAETEMKKGLYAIKERVDMKKRLICH